MPGPRAHVRGLTVTDDDKTPVDTKCGAQIRARDGSVLNYVCNLDKGHLGRHAEVLREGDKELIVEDNAK